MELSKKKLDRILMTVTGNILYACGVNLMINPIHLYSGGFTGIAQLIRLFLTGFLRIPEIPGIDYMGVIYFAINIPLLLITIFLCRREFPSPVDLGVKPVIDFKGIALISILLIVFIIYFQLFGKAFDVVSMESIVMIFIRICPPKNRLSAG